MIVQRHLGLTTRFNILTIALILATSIGIGTFVTLRGHASSYERLLRKGMTTAAMVAQNSEYGIYAEDRTILQQIVESLKADEALKLMHPRILELNEQFRQVEERIREAVSRPSKPT